MTGLARSWQHALTDAEIARYSEGYSDGRAAAEAALRGLMEIAEQAMPDTYFATDSRVQAARAVLGEEK